MYFNNAVVLFKLPDCSQQVKPTAVVAQQIFPLSGRIQCVLCAQSCLEEI